ncbi:unnamed protein product [Rhizophagus irregularis]|nr:unnamed protein product [Rhizophagus irregularis]CAB5355077.1 unnamed protein product [Rhizophagus irregularis]
MVTSMPSQMPFRRKHKKKKKLNLKDLEASKSVSKLKPTPIAKKKKTKNVKDTEKKEALYIITGYQPTGPALANVNDIIIYDIPLT